MAAKSHNTKVRRDVKAVGSFFFTSYFQEFTAGQRPQKGYPILGRCLLRRGVQGWQTHEAALIAAAGAAANDEIETVRASNRSQES